MNAKQGNLSINSENIFPIIKKWLYSDHDIFVRELVSNGCDAITKLKKLSLMGEYTLPESYAPCVQVETNDEEKTITFIDNGLGMTAEEVDQYINQIAFSGAKDFLEKYKDKSNDDQIIGHFGLGFYSAFMVADRVEIDTLSFREGAEAVHWESDGGMDYAMEGSEKTDIGTRITLHLNEDSYEFSNEYRVREILEKYCSFMPTEIYLHKENAEPEYDEVETGEKDADGNPIKEKVLKTPQPINDTTPLWTKHPNECTDEEYKEFYHKVFRDYKEPLFWIHLNMDYPFNLKGILYFPQINTEYESIEGTIKLFSNQVFIADNIKEVIPEFLMLLKGVIDCPDLPLNVSRSALQNDGFVKKISDYITKKVSDKLSGMCKTDRENYEKYWDDINPFIKYGCLKDEKFYEKMKDYVLFKNLDGKYLTLEDARRENEETHKDTIFYVTNEEEQGQYIHMFREANMDAVIMKTTIDSPFISMLEAKNEGLKFLRIDADLTDSFKEESDEEEMKKATDSLAELFKKALALESLTVKAEKLKNNEIASMITVSEENRRMQDMMKMYGMGASAFGPAGETLVLNVNHPLVSYALDHAEEEAASTICKQLYDMAKLSNGTLPQDRMTEFLARTNEIMMLLTK